jgi:hypothetical protein
MPTPAACKPIESEIENLRSELVGAQDEMKQAVGGSQKAAVAQRIKAVLHALKIKRAEFNSCLVKNGVVVPTPLSATFNASYVVCTSTEGQAAGPHRGSIVLPVQFSADRTGVMITSFPDIATDTYDTGLLGMNITTVRQAGGGFGGYDSATGDMLVRIKLLFDQSIDIPIVEEDSTVSFSLSTTAKTTLCNLAGSPLDSAGKVALAGEAPFVGGFLEGKTCALGIAGTIDPHP